MSKSSEFLNNKTKKMILFLSLLAVMMVFYLCNLNKIYIYGTCETYSLLQIPVIIGALVGGPSVGLLLTLIYGVTDIVYASFSTSYTDVLLSPLAKSNLFGYIISGNIFSLIMCFLPKIVLAAVAGFIFKYLKDRGKNIWQFILYSVCTCLAVTCSFFVFIGLFNLFFMTTTSINSNIEDFMSIVNTSTTLAFFQKILINLLIDPFAAFTIKNVANIE